MLCKVCENENYRSEATESGRSDSAATISSDDADRDAKRIGWFLSSLCSIHEVKGGSDLRSRERGSCIETEREGGKMSEAEPRDTKTATDLRKARSNRP